MPHQYWGDPLPRARDYVNRHPRPTARLMRQRALVDFATAWMATNRTG